MKVIENRRGKMADTADLIRKDSFVGNIKEWRIKEKRGRVRRRRCCLDVIKEKFMSGRISNSRMGRLIDIVGD